ncbi:MAG TPA: OmpW family outer membrane protein [Paucimonas sp.]|nr:OmpW family outer membrane protein [Paucimonas sp.]HJW57921.1 OmpW family outer membrane protein [Burkholderiaceae bacterium]
MKITRFMVCATLGMAAIAAHAQQNTVRVGVAHLAIHSDSPNLSSNGPAFLTPQPAGLTVGDATTLLLAYTRRLDQHWAFEVDMGVPPRHDVNGTGTLQPFGVIARVKQAGPTVFVNYNFGAEENKFRPFLGVGVNYTHFFDAQSSSSGNLASGGPTKISLSDSVGLAAQVGASYQLTDRWSLVGSIVAAKVKSDMTATTGSLERKTTIDFRPVVYTLGVAYRF